MDRNKAIELLKTHSKDPQAFEKVLKHSEAVCKLALELGKKTFDNGYFVDMEFLETASLLHDIGRFDCPPSSEKSILHGIRGAEILTAENLPDHALVAERHIGSGISKEDIEEQGLALPPKDYEPETIEEKIITYADNLIFGERRGTIAEVIERFRKEVGEKCVSKTITLHNEVMEMIGDEKSRIASEAAKKE